MILRRQTTTPTDTYRCSAEERLGAEGIASFSYSPEFAAISNDPAAYFKKELSGLHLDEFSGDILDRLIQNLIDSELTRLDKQIAQFSLFVQQAEAAMPAYIKRLHDELDSLVEFDCLIEEQLDIIDVLEGKKRGV